MEFYEYTPFLWLYSNSFDRIKDCYMVFAKLKITIFIVFWYNSIPSSLLIYFQAQPPTSYTFGVCIHKVKVLNNMFTASLFWEHALGIILRIYHTCVAHLNKIKYTFTSYKILSEFWFFKCICWQEFLNLAYSEFTMVYSD